LDVKNGVDVVSVKQYNSVITMIKIKVVIDSIEKNLFIFDVWIPFDDGSTKQLATFQTTLNLLEAFKDQEIETSEHLIAIIGDFQWSWM